VAHTGEETGALLSSVTGFSFAWLFTHPQQKEKEK